MPAIIWRMDEGVLVACSALFGFCRVEVASQSFRRHWLRENYVRVVKEVHSSSSFVSTPQLDPVFAFMPELFASEFRLKGSRCEAARLFSHVRAAIC